jgi:hypothetical protein
MDAKEQIAAQSSRIRTLENHLLFILEHLDNPPPTHGFLWWSYRCQDWRVTVLIPGLRKLSSEIQERRLKELKGE